ncbi:DNA cytosine methyltransferase [Micromonospora tulbaghiae]|uniref:DNA cytosine methyltransferase n=1 Tax=Micromonospora tulbaghiae TaxID=479978 RepID=UPI0036476E73
MAVELVLGGHLTWYAETDRHAATVCAHHWPNTPNLGDIRTVDWTRVAPVDVLTAGFPCHLQRWQARRHHRRALQPVECRRRRRSRPSTAARVRGERRRAPTARVRRRRS